MVVHFLYLLGLLVFVLGVGILGVWLRMHPTKADAEKLSRVAHFLFFAGLGAPFLLSIFYPGLPRLDGWIGLDPLPYPSFFTVMGILLALPGLYLLGVSNRSLRASGKGANAFRLTQRIVDLDIYRYTRNPMSLGYYLYALSIGFLAGSTFLTLYVLIGLFPAHLFFLKFFEELELELRFGESYRQYKQKVPFLVPRRPVDSFSAGRDEP